MSSRHAAYSTGFSLTRHCRLTRLPDEIRGPDHHGEGTGRPEPRIAEDPAWTYQQQPGHQRGQQEEHQGLVLQTDPGDQARPEPDRSAADPDRPDGKPAEHGP